MDISQPVWVTCSSVWPPSQGNSFFSVTVKCHWLTFNQLFTRTSRASSAILPSSWSMPNWHVPVCTGMWGYSSQGQDFAFDELHEVPIGPFLQPVKAHLYGRKSNWCIKYHFQFWISCRSVKGMSYPIIQAIKKDVQQYWSQRQKVICL